jgi:hypothetical protein
MRDMSLGADLNLLLVSERQQIPLNSHFARLEFLIAAACVNKTRTIALDFGDKVTKSLIGFLSPNDAAGSWPT